MARREFLGAMLWLAAAPAIACLPKAEPTLVVLDEAASFQPGLWSDLPPRHWNCRSSLSEDDLPLTWADEYGIRRFERRRSAFARAVYDAMRAMW